MPTTYPKVSVMIPVYNQAAYIAQAVKSALALDYPNLEVIISDDCSTDNSPAIIKNFLIDPRVRYFRNEQNAGIPGNFRKLLCEYATGEWVVMLDADDYFIETKFISCAMEKIRRYNDIALVIFGYKASYTDKEYVLVPSAETKYMRGRDVFMRFPRMNVVHANVLYKRESAVKVGAYEYGYSSDYAMFLKMLLHGNALLLNIVNYVWRHHTTNHSDTSSLETYLLANKKYVEDVYRYAIGLGLCKKEMDGWKKKMLVWYYFTYISRTVRSLERGLIAKKEADSNINNLTAHLFSNERFLLFTNVDILGRIVLYKLFGAKIFESFMHLAKKIRQKNRYTLVKNA